MVGYVMIGKAQRATVDKASAEGPFRDSFRRGPHGVVYLVHCSARTLRVAAGSSAKAVGAVPIETHVAPRDQTACSESSCPAVERPSGSGCSEPVAGAAQGGAGLFSLDAPQPLGPSLTRKCDACDKGG